MSQMGIFDGKKKFRNDKPIRLIELFGGISAQATALHELDVEFKHYRYVDFDKYAVKSTNAMYGTTFEPMDITKIKASDLGVVETDKYTYIITYSFPCQDLSNAGKGAGMAKGSGTRSGLLWEVERLLNEMTELPQVLLMENVPQVHGKKNIDSFNEWIEFLESKGYKNYWQDLKATDFGIPQSRNRTFMVSLLGDYYYSFPKGFKLKYLLKDFLESEVDEKYYLSDNAISGIVYTTFNSSKLENRSEKSGIDPTLMARDYKDPKLVQVGTLNIKGNDSIKRVYSPNGLSPTLTTMEGGNRQPKIQEQTNIKNIMLNVATTLGTNCGSSTSAGGEVVIEPICLNSKVDGKQPSLQDRVYDSSAVSTAITTSFHPSYTDGLRIRKLTPKECWRLMGFRDELFDKAKSVNSNAQLYKQAGNSIVTTVLMAIFGELLDINWHEKVEILLKNIMEEEDE